MDPTECYLDMYVAMRDGQFSLARRKAVSLKRWLDAGGPWPAFYSREEVTGYLANVLRRTIGDEGRDIVDEQGETGRV